MITAEQPHPVEAVKIPEVRHAYGQLADLGENIRVGGMHRPVILWKDGTIISGSRRLRALFLLGKHSVPAVFVDTIEDAAKMLQFDLANDYLAKPMLPSEMCRLWEVLRRLDRPAAVARHDAHRRRGVELRRQTQSGKRKPGRGSTRTEDYVLAQVAPAFGMSVTTAKRLWRIYELCQSPVPERRAAAQKALDAIDRGNASISATYEKLTSVKVPAPLKTVAAPTAPPSNDRQVAAWHRALPQMEGLVAGLQELGAPNPSLTWEQVGPVHARLMKIRRDMEQIIKKMRESNQS